MKQWLLPILFAGWALGADPAEEHFTLRLPDLSDLTDYQLTGGGRVIVPVGKTIKHLQFVLPPAAVRHLENAGRVGVKVNGKALDDVDIKLQANTLFANVASDSDDGFVPAGAPVKVEAAGMRKNQFGQTWMLRQGKTSFLREQVGEAGGAPLDLDLTKPALAIQMDPADASLDVEVSGSAPAELATLTVNGAAFPFQKKIGRTAFGGSVKIPRGTKRLEIRATDKSGNSCTIWVPVLSM
jgi:hypothetical protein